MRALSKAVAGLGSIAGLLHGQAVLAVTDMVGGPAIRQLNFAAPVTRIAEEIHWLHWMMLVICSVIFIGVFGVMFYSIFKHRKSLGHKPASFHESTTVEIIWTIVPLLIVIGMALPATKTVVAMKDTTNSDITIKATGYQWKWGYDYLKGEGEGISFLSTLSTPREQINNLAPKTNTYLMEVDNEVVVPVNKKIRIVTTANDVIHAWMIPAFGVKQDAIPGFVRDTWFRAEKTGIYRGQCAELCGKEHAFMPIVVRVVTDDEYSAWVADKQKEMAAKADDPTKTFTLDELQQRGEKVYAANCAVCHQPNGKGAGAFPGLDGSKVVNGPFAGHMEIMLNGKNAMPAWKQLNDVELAAVTTYVRNAWGNKTGELIQPAQYTQARAGTYPAGGGTATAGAPAKEDAPATAAAVPAEALPAKIFFASGKSSLAADEIKAIEAVAGLLKADSAMRIDISGYVDSSGSAARNAELAKERAKAVRDALKAAGVDEARINMKKPEMLTGGSDGKQARRVEISKAG